MQTIDIQALKDLNREKGWFFFSQDAVRFFRSKVAKHAYLTQDGSLAYFVTSERFKGCDGRLAQRHYKVRVMKMATGRVQTAVGNYTTGRETTKKAKELAS